MRLSLLAAFLIALLLTLPASGAVLFETTTLNPAGETVDEGTVTIEGEQVRIDQGDQTVLYGGNEMAIMNHPEQWVLPMDREAIANLGQQMSAIKQQMEAALSQVPEGQRDAYRQMLEQQMGGSDDSAAVEEVEMEAGESSEVAGYGCRLWLARQGDRVLQELCVADPGDIEGAPAALAAIRSMAEAFEDVVSSLRDAFPGAANHPALQGNPFAQLSKIDGFPIQVTVFENGQRSDTTRILPAGNTTVAPGFFDSRPEGYEVRSLSGR